MSMFYTLFEKATSINELDLFVNENIEHINSFANQNYDALNKSRDSIEKFILLKNQTLISLDYKRSYNKAFISILIEICERLGESSSLLRIYSIFQNNDIYIGERLNAVLLYLHGISANHEFEERFDLICKKIEYSAKNEEDSINKPVATFLNFYSYAIYNTKPHVRFAEGIRQKIINAIESKTYNFLHHNLIQEALSLSFEDIEFTFQQIQKLIAELSKVESLDLHYAVEDLLIEVETEHSKLIKKIQISFDAIRNITIKNTDGKAFTNRGTSILETDAQLCTYMYRFGNMHKAKLDSAFNYLPVELFSTNINIIDWGCGQGIASIVLFDKINPHNVTNCILIEPSEKSIKRAALNIKAYNSELKIKTICKKLDSLVTEDFPKFNGITLHLFSNILDIDDYNQSQLTELISATQNGQNYFICVSPYIDDRKSDRVDNFKRRFEKKYANKFKLLGEDMNSRNSDSTYWCCNNKYKNNMCPFHPEECEGMKKWTRVTKVFKLDIPPL